MHVYVPHFGRLPLLILAALTPNFACTLVTMRIILRMIFPFASSTIQSMVWTGKGHFAAETLHLYCTLQIWHEVCACVYPQFPQSKHARCLPVVTPSVSRA